MQKVEETPANNSKSQPDCRANRCLVGFSFLPPKLQAIGSDLSHPSPASQNRCLLTTVRTAGLYSIEEPTDPFGHQRRKTSLVSDHMLRNGLRRFISYSKD